jgi:hypothetical protein
MSLLQKASIVTTPTAYGVGVLNSIKPAYTLGGNLVVNGNFSNGATNWTGTRGASLTAADNVLTVSSDSSTYGAAARQVISTEIGKKYKWNFTINEANDTRVAIYNGTADFGFGTSIIQINDLLTGSYSYTFIAISSSVSVLLGTMTLSGQEKYSNVSVVQQTDADFDFTRNSSATRVNPDYLIQDVSILSSNLVQNENFSELGSQLVVNGDFSDGLNGWSSHSGSILELEGSKAKVTTVGSQGFIKRTDLSIQSGKIYFCTAQITNATIPQFYINGTSNALNPMPLISGDTYGGYITTTGNNSTFYIRGNNVDGQVSFIDNVS